jgi:hypothetical protein
VSVTSYLTQKWNKVFAKHKETDFQVEMSKPSQVFKSSQLWLQRKQHITTTYKNMEFRLKGNIFL